MFHRCRVSAVSENWVFPLTLCATFGSTGHVPVRTWTLLPLSGRWRRVHYLPLCVTETQMEVVVSWAVRLDSSPHITDFLAALSTEMAEQVMKGRLRVFAHLRNGGPRGGLKKFWTRVRASRPRGKGNAKMLPQENQEINAKKRRKARTAGRRGEGGKERDEVVFSCVSRASAACYICSRHAVFPRPSDEADSLARPVRLARLARRSRLRAAAAAAPADKPQKKITVGWGMRLGLLFSSVRGRRHDAERASCKRSRPVVCDRDVVSERRRRPPGQRNVCLPFLR